MEKPGFSLVFILQHALTLVLFYGLSHSNKPQTNFSPKACLPEFESGSNPISRTGLVPIGILVSSANTHRTQVTQGAYLRAHRPSKSSVKHASHKAKAYRAGQSSEELNRRRGTQRCCTQNRSGQIPAHSPGQEAHIDFIAVCKHVGATRKQNDPMRCVCD